MYRLKLVATALVAVFAASCKPAIDASAVRDDNTPGGGSGKPITGSITEGDLGEDFLTLQREFHTIKDTGLDSEKPLAGGHALEAFLSKLDKDYDSLKSPAAKLWAAQLAPLAHMRSLIFRLNKITDRTALGKSVAVTNLMTAAAGIDHFLNTSDERTGRLFFHYFAMPSAEKGSRPFESIGQFQDELVGLLPAISKAASRLEALMPAAKNGIPWDNRNLYGPESYRDNAADRFLLIREAELAAMIAVAYASIHNVQIFSAYDLEDLPEVSTKLAKLIGFDSPLSARDVDGTTAEDRTAAIRSFSGFGKLRDGGSARFREAYAALQQTAKWARSSRQAGESAPAHENAVAFADRLTPWKKYSDRAFENFYRMATSSGEVAMRNDITGEPFSVNVKKFYETPPRDLKEFLPTSFANEQTTGEKRRTDSQFGEFRNYFYGRAINWSAQAYSPYLPSVSKGSSVGPVARSFIQTYGVGGTGQLMSLFIL